MKRTKMIIWIILILWFAFIVTDYSLARVNRPPVFAIPTVIYKDGGSAQYYGLGYKVIKYVDLTVEHGPKIVKVDFGTWFMKFSHPRQY